MCHLMDLFFIFSDLKVQSNNMIPDITTTLQFMLYSIQNVLDNLCSVVIRCKKNEIISDLLTIFLKISKIKIHSIILHMI